MSNLKKMKRFIFNLHFITVPPVIKQEGLTKEFETVENKTLHINCPVEGVPFPSILWLKDRTPLLDFPYENIKVINEGQRLMVIQAKVKDSTKYTCQATNIAGQVKETFTLKVYGKSVHFVSSFFAISQVLEAHIIKNTLIIYIYIFFG